MKASEVPQDASILQGHQRACYAVDETGRYVVVPSKGWEVEEIVNAQAQAEIRATVARSLSLVLAGKVSALAYHMARRQMSVGLLAANSGIWRLRVRYHLRPRAFARLKRTVLQRYADALAISLDDLMQVPASTDAS